LVDLGCLGDHDRCCSIDRGVLESSTVALSQL
jgi:hypothetical protein